MPSATLTSKGQITIPAAVRQAMGLESGQRVEFLPLANNQFQLIAANKPASRLKGIVQATRTVSLEEMDDAIAQEAQRLQPGRDA